MFLLPPLTRKKKKWRWSAPAVLPKRAPHFSGWPLSALLYCSSSAYRMARLSGFCGLSPWLESCSLARRRFSGSFIFIPCVKMNLSQHTLNSYGWQFFIQSCYSSLRLKITRLYGLCSITTQLAGQSWPFSPPAFGLASFTSAGRENARIDDQRSVIGLRLTVTAFIANYGL